MKDLFSKISGFSAIGLSAYAFIPLISEVIQNGVAAFEGCKVAAAPFFASVAAVVAAYLAKSPLQTKK